MAFDQVAYTTEFKRQNYDKIRLIVRKGGKAVLKDIAKKNNTSLNKLILQAVEEEYNIDLTTKR